MYPAFVRTYLEFSSAVWNSMTKIEVNWIGRFKKGRLKWLFRVKGNEILMINMGENEGYGRRHNSQITNEKQGALMINSY